MTSPCAGVVALHINSLAGALLTQFSQSVLHIHTSIYCHWHSRQTADGSSASPTTVDISWRARRGAWHAIHREHHDVSLRQIIWTAPSGADARIAEVARSPFDPDVDIKLRHPRHARVLHSQGSGLVYAQLLNYTVMLTARSMSWTGVPLPGDSYTYTCAYVPRCRAAGYGVRMHASVRTSRANYRVGGASQNPPAACAHCVGGEGGGYDGGREVHRGVRWELSRACSVGRTGCRRQKGAKW